MKTHSTSHLSIKTALCALALGLGLAAASTAQAVVVNWDLNPDNLNQSLGSASHTFISDGFSLTAYGYDNVAGADTPHTLFYKDEGPGGDHGLGVVGTPHNELQANPDGSSAQYIQFDLRSILAAGFLDGALKVSSVDAPTHEVFEIYGSNALGTLGTKISIPGGYDESFNNVFVNIPDWGNYDFISVGASVGDVLPWALAVKMPPVPEIGGMSAAFVLVAFLGVVLATRAIRLRQTI